MVAGSSDALADGGVVGFPVRGATSCDRFASHLKQAVVVSVFSPQTSQMLLLPAPEPASGQEPPFRRDLEGWGADVNIPVAVPPSVRSLSQMHNSRAADAAVGTIGRT